MNRRSLLALFSALPAVPLLKKKELPDLPDEAVRVDAKPIDQAGVEAFDRMMNSLKFGARIDPKTPGRIHIYKDFAEYKRDKEAMERRLYEARIDAWESYLWGEKP